MTFTVTCSRVELIAFTSAREGGQNIWLLHLDGSSPARATSGGIDIDFAWAPDGTRFAYVNQRGALDELWVAAWTARARPASLCDRALVP